MDGLPRFGVPDFDCSASGRRRQASTIGAPRDGIHLVVVSRQVAQFSAAFAIPDFGLTRWPEFASGRSQTLAIGAEGH